MDNLSSKLVDEDLDSFYQILTTNYQKIFGSEYKAVVAETKNLEK